MKRIFFRICVAAFILFALLVISFIVWRVSLAHDVNAKLQAIRAAGLPTRGAELNAYYPAVSDNENAALLMAQAFALMRNYPDSRSNEVANFKIPLRGQPLTAEQKLLLTGYIEMNSAALAKAQEAVKLPKSRYPVNASLNAYTPFPHLSLSKNLARIFEFKALLEDSSSAVSSITNISLLARTLNNEPFLISQLVRIAEVKMAVITLEQCLNKNQLDESKLIGMTPAFFEAEKTNLMALGLIGERAIDIPYFRANLIELDKVADALLGQTNQQPFIPTNPDGITRISGFLERDLNFYLRTMETNISFAMLCPPESLTITNSEAKIYREIKHKYYILSGVLLPALSKAIIREAEEFACVREAQVGLAVERFRLASGTLPENLNELVPQFLSAVPVDPFDGQPMRYHRLTKGYVIYSVGRDGHDNGGRERPSDAKSSDKTEYDITFTVER